MVQTIGIDLGSQKCMLVADDADIVLTDTGSIARPTLVSFFGKSRLVGEEAAPQVMSQSCTLVMFLPTIYIIDWMYSLGCYWVK